MLNDPVHLINGKEKPRLVALSLDYMHAPINLQHFL
jgi:hypothetical protein